jgi:tRNA(adenine34) deaminase
MNVDLDTGDAPYEAPFPDRGHRAALRAFPLTLAESENSDDAAISRQTSDFWQSHWTGQTLTDQDGHFELTQGEPIAQTAVNYFVSPQPD